MPTQNDRYTRDVYGELVKGSLSKMGFEVTVLSFLNDSSTYAGSKNRKR